MMDYRNNIVKDTENADEIYIAGHVNPDGDAVGAAFALALYLKRLGRQPRVLLESIPKRFAFFKGTDMWYNGDYDDITPDVFFAVDCGDLKRLGKAGDVFLRAKKTYCIDHHRTNEGLAQADMIDPDASSASEIVYEILKQNGFDAEKDIDIATDIYAGMVFDTGGFKHNCTSKRTHEIAGALVEGGVDTSTIHSRVLYEHTLPQARLFGKALSNMKHKSGVTYTALTTAEIESCGCTSEDLDGIVDFLLNLDASDCAVLVTQRSENTAKASVRSKSFPIADIVVALGGGGHKLAAGVTCEGTADEVAEMIVEKIAAAK